MKKNGFGFGIWNLKFALVVLLLVICGTFVSGLGVTPARKIVEYEAGVQKLGEFTVINSEGREMSIAMRVDGEFAHLLRIPQATAVFGAGEYGKKFYYELIFPNEDEEMPRPGVHDLNVIVSEVSGAVGGDWASIGAAPAVVTQVRINVPYPGKYLEALMDIYQSRATQEVTFVIPVRNLGAEDIKKVSASIEINREGKQINEVQTNYVELLPRTGNDLVALWQSSLPGIYEAVAYVNYDGKIVKIEKEFEVGRGQLEITDVEVKEFALGGVARFDIRVENRWDEEIKDLYGQMTILDKNGKVIADFKTARLNIEPLDEGGVEAFWDTENVEAGNYDVKVVLFFDGKKLEREFEIVVDADRIETRFVPFTPTARAVAPLEKRIDKRVLYIGGVVLLILVNIILFLFFRRRLKSG